MFDLKTMLEYFDSLFIDFEKERLSRKVYEEVSKDFDNSFRPAVSVFKSDDI